jgi:predicted MFS family arabinose efflux permease
MSLAAALGTATIYPLQPAIADVAGSLDVSAAAVGVALACGPLGYMFGLGLLVPLVDRFPPGRVLSAQAGVLAAALLVSALVGSVWALGAAIGVTGACSTVGARRVILAGLVIAGAAAAIIGFALPSAAATVAWLALFDAGLFAAQVANQSTILAIDPAAPARFNSAYMLVYFVGGSLGTAFGAAAVERFGWPATTTTTAAAIAVAAAITLRAG